MANSRTSWIFGIVCAILFAGLANAQRELKTIPDPDPEIERRSFQVADGFEVLPGPGHAFEDTKRAFDSHAERPFLLTLAPRDARRGA